MSDRSETRSVFDAGIEKLSGLYEAGKNMLNINQNRGSGPRTDEEKNKEKQLLEQEQARIQALEEEKKARAIEAEKQAQMQAKLQQEKLQAEEREEQERQLQLQALETERQELLQASAKLQYQQMQYSMVQAHQAQPLQQFFHNFVQNSTAIQGQPEETALNTTADTITPNKLAVGTAPQQVDLTDPSLNEKEMRMAIELDNLKMQLTNAKIDLVNQKIEAAHEKERVKKNVPVPLPIGADARDQEIKSLQEQLNKAKTEKENAERMQQHAETSRWLNATGNTTAFSSKLPDPMERRMKILDNLAKNPIDTWTPRTNGSLYVFLRMHAEEYLDSRSLTKAETSQAIAAIFRLSPAKQKKAKQICIDTLPNYPESLNDRESTYKQLSIKLDENRTSVIDALNIDESLEDLFQRAKTIMEVEYGEELSEVAANKLNHRVIMRILDPKQELMNEDDQLDLKQLFYSMTVSDKGFVKGCVDKTQVENLISSFDSMRDFRCNQTHTIRSKKANDVAMQKSTVWNYNRNRDQKTGNNSCPVCYGKDGHSIKNCPLIKNGPCEICLKNGKARETIKHITEDHRYTYNNFKPNNAGRQNNNLEQRNDNANNFGAAPQALKNFNRNLNTIDTRIQLLKDSREIFPSQEDKYLCARLECGSKIIEAKLDTGCTFEAAIEEKLIYDLQLEDHTEKTDTSLVIADGTTINSTMIVQIPVRYKNIAVTITAIALPKLPAKFLLGKPGMDKLGMLQALEKEINASKEETKNL